MEVASVAFPQWAMMIESMAKLRDDLLQMDKGSAVVEVTSLVGRTACFKLVIEAPAAAAKLTPNTPEWQACTSFDGFQRALCEHCIPFDAQRNSSSDLIKHRAGRDLVSRFGAASGRRIEASSEVFEDEALAIASALLSDDGAAAEGDLRALAVFVPSLDGDASSLAMVAACRRGRARESLALLRENGWRPTASDSVHAMEWMGEFGPPGSAIFQLQALRSELECAEFLDRIGITRKFMN